MFLKNIDNVKETESNLTFATWDHLAGQYIPQSDLRSPISVEKHLDVVLWVTEYVHTMFQDGSWISNNFTLLQVDFDPDGLNLSLSRLLINESHKDIHIEIGELLERSLNEALAA